MPFGPPLHHRAPAWVGHATATVAVVFASALPVREDQSPDWQGDLAVIAVVSAALLLLRRRLPVPTVAAAVGVIWVAVPLALFNPGPVT